MLSAPSCSKTGHVLLYESKTSCVPKPCGLQPAWKHIFKH